MSAIGASKVEMIPLNKLDFDDHTFMFRANLRVGSLRKSLEAEGQQQPIVLRRPKPKARTFQIVCGFRRATALQELGVEQVAAIVRDDLVGDDEQTFKVSVLENTARQTYSDIDRALVIRRYETAGYSSQAAAALMGLSKRQKNKLVSLLELPEDVQAAIDEPDTRFKTKHALLLKKMKSRYPDLDYMRWIEACNEEDLSVAQLTRRVNTEYKTADEAFETLFRADGTNWDQQQVRFLPLTLKLSEMSTTEKSVLREQLEKVIGLL